MKLTMTNSLVALVAVLLSHSAQAAVDATDACQAAKFKQAGSLAKCLQSTESKFLASGDTEKYAVAVSKCTTAFSKKWAAAEQKAADAGGACATSGDQDEVEDWIQQSVACVTTALETGDATCMLCGNGNLDAGEGCDIGKQRAATCSSETSGARTYGELKCGTDCQLDTSGCTEGAVVGGSEWFLSPAPGLSCDSVCLIRGRVYDEATRTFAGSDGTAANCRAVITALGHPLLAVSSIPNAQLGCYWIDGYPAGMWDTLPTTSYASANPSTGILRVCACK